jgi:hypothetical protein
MLDVGAGTIDFKTLLAKGRAPEAGAVTTDTVPATTS